MNNCVFCRIAKKELPSISIYEDERVMAIVPKEQVTKGHILVIPKDHYENIFDVDDQIFQHMALKIKEIASKLVKDNHATGINVLNASGKDAQQSVMHLHFHLVPRFSGDGLDMWIKQSL